MNIRTPGRMRALLRKTSSRAGAVALAAVAVTAFLATSASAAQAAPAVNKAGPGCVGTLDYDRIQAQTDNCPGNGHASWAWLWVPTGGNAVTGYLANAKINLVLANGTKTSFNVDSGGSWTQNYDSKIVTISACEYYVTPNGVYTWQCSHTYPAPNP